MGEIIQNPSDTGDGSGFIDLTGRDIGRYHIQKRLGRGGLTTVYQAYDMVDDFPVALKILLNGADEKVYNRFRYEAQTAAKLQHPHIVRTLRVGVATNSDTAYIAMELVEGEDLAALLANRRRLSAEEGCLLLAPIAEALAYAHQRGVIHRDVKPSNILLRTVRAGTPNSIILDTLDYPLVPLLSDFGIARALDVPELTHSGRTVGTPAFMAPEQCLGRRNIDHRADLYALGAVFYRCITGRQPFVGSTVQILHAHVYDQVTIEEETLRQLSQIHIQLLQHTLAKDPEDRYQTAAEVAADLALGINPAARQMTVAQHEQNETITLNLLPVSKTNTLSGPLTVLVPVATEQTTPSLSAAQQPQAAEPSFPTPDVYYDPVLDRRLRKWSGIVLFILLLLISLFLGLSFMGVSVTDLWQRVHGFWQPFQSPVLALDDEPSHSALGSTTANNYPIRSTVRSHAPVVANGNGEGRAAPGVVAQSAEERLTPSPIATTALLSALLSVSPVANPITILPQPTAPVASVATATATATSPPETPSPTAETINGLCTTLPDPTLQPVIAQLDEAVRPDFRCATGLAVTGNGELLRFAYGSMIYLHATGTMFIVSTTDKQWEDLELSWLDGDTIPPPGEIEVPEEGLFIPKRMFGKLWQNERIRTMLGDALMPEAIRFPVAAQKFPGGWLVLNRERPDEHFLFLRNQRRW
ncbi:MAG: protein kinase [Caldilineaceae bacterium]